MSQNKSRCHVTITSGEKTDKLSVKSFRNDKQAMMLAIGLMDPFCRVTSRNPPPIENGSTIHFFSLR